MILKALTFTPNRVRNFALIACALLSGLACAQNTVSDTEAQLKGKVVFLRGNAAESTLHFDGTGKPRKDYATVSFTESGFREQSVKLKHNTLKIEGVRTGLKFDKAGGVSYFDIGTMTIEIEGDPTTDFHNAVDQIFAPNLAALVPSLPSWWQSYAHKHFLEASTDAPKVPEASKAHDPTTASKPLHVGGSVITPKILSAPQATYTQLARDQRFSGSVEIYLWVGKDGLPSHFSLVRPTGMGLDEHALSAVAKYRFAPATKDGKPVNVDLYVDVSFERVP